MLLKQIILEYTREQNGLKIPIRVEAIIVTRQRIGRKKVVRVEKVDRIDF